MLVNDYPETFGLVQIPINCLGATPWGDARAAFYSMTATPWVFFDGVEDVAGTFADLDEQYNQYLSAFQARQAIPTDVTIDVAASVIPRTDDYRVGTRVCLEAGGTAKTMRIYVVQLLDNYPEYPEWSHSRFKQAAAPEDITLSPGECQTILRDFTFDDDSWAQQSDIKILVWAQEPQDTSPPEDRAEVFQAAIMSWPFPPDCNENGVPDDEDIASGYSDDDNGNGVPDECERPVYAGSDLFVTPGPAGEEGPTYRDFSGIPIPPDFFGPGSDPFDGVVYLRGAPLTGSGLPPSADTIVERLQDAELPDPYNSEDTVDTQILALSLVSSLPIYVTFNGGADWALYDVEMCLTSTEVQPLGQMTIRHECLEGGSFDATTPVIPKLNFTWVLGTEGVASATLDPAPQLDFVVTGGTWSHTDPGFGIYTSPGGTVDGDCSGVADVPYPATSNFIAGVRWIGCSEAASVEARKRITIAQDVLAAHGTLPPETGEENDSDADGIHDVADNCPDDYDPFQEDADADTVGDDCDNCPDDYNPFQEDADGDDWGDLCDNCPNTYNPGQEDGDGDGWGDACDYCYGDLNDDRLRNLSDLAQLLAHYGDTGVSYEDGDLSGDGDVDLQDLAEMLAVYGDPCPT